MTQKLTESDCEIMFQTVKYPIDMDKIYDTVEQILADHLKPVSEPLSRHEFDMAITSSMQPGFVEWMMGYPQDWTDLNCQKPATELLGLKD
jgi:hypothetical protein